MRSSWDGGVIYAAVGEAVFLARPANPRAAAAANPSV